METLTVGVKDALCGTFLRHCNGVSNCETNYFGSLDHTFTASTHSLRSPSEIDLHSRLTRGFSQGTACTVVKNARRRAKNMLLLRPTDILSDVCESMGGGWGVRRVYARVIYEAGYFQLSC